MPHVAATFEDFAAAGRLLHDFNTEFGAASPGIEVIADRLHAGSGCRVGAYPAEPFNR